MTTNTHIWGKPILTPAQDALVEGYLCEPDEYAPHPTTDEVSALIFYAALKTDAEALVERLGGVPAFHAEARRFRPWLVSRDLPERFTLWQGTAAPEDQDVSWTLSPKVATTFAAYLTKLKGGTGPGFVRSTEITRDMVLVAMAHDTLEAEVIWEKTDA